jgi:hypothetical protein
VIGLAALAVIVASTFGTREVMLAVGVLAAAAIGAGWPHFLAVPAKKTLAAVIGLAGIGSAVSATYLPPPGYLDWTPAFIAMGVIAVFVVQLIRGTGQAQRLESTLGCCAGVLLNCLGAGWIAGARFTGVKEMVLVAGLSAAVALMGCLRGLAAQGGAEGVGYATTRAVVLGCEAILVLDAFWAVALVSVPGPYAAANRCRNSVSAPLRISS